MTAHQIELQLRGVLGCDRHVRQPPETGGDAVDRFAFCEVAIDELTRSRYARSRLGCDLDRGAVSDGFDRLKA
jgi:hypothetical protein